MSRNITVKYHAFLQYMPAMANVPKYGTDNNYRAVFEGIHNKIC